MSVILVGVPQFTAALDALVAAAGEATKIAVIKGGHLIQAETQKKLTTSSHKKGTPTPSQPGEPPSLVTGQLRRSIRTDHPNRGGDGIWSTRIGPTAAYGRIQELGGVTGRGHATTLPARPYLAPALEAAISSGRLGEVFDEAWRVALGHL
ncbi:hypothetical protein [Actinocrinis sp.]|uniref:hypothetical protein n=1 Tax=Actinocrinis sp. TaxID=1920516 RepID=UPI002D675F83|nr:hypothetical protein [Actinocrinis sp.]HZP55033.1 hypothetical protein [Actinocrinis sp.]